MTELTLLLADTYRSRVYLSSFLTNGLGVQKVVFYKCKARESIGTVEYEPDSYLFDQLSDNLPNLEGFMFQSTNSVEEMAISANINLKVIEVDMGVKSISKSFFGSDATIIFSGYPGEIVPPELVNNCNFIHAHGGILPDYKGSTTNYYSFIETKTVGASVISMNSEIDAGNILHVYKISISSLLELDYIVDNALRAKALFQFLNGNVKSLSPIKNTEGAMFYVAHPHIRQIARNI